MRSIFAFLVIAVVGCTTSSGDVMGIHPDASDVDACLGCDFGPRDAHADGADLGMDAGPDLGVADLGSDLGPTDGGLCGDGGACCNRASECSGGAVCVGHNCAMPTTCTSSTMCAPGVCAMMGVGVCADCNIDSDCTRFAGTRCAANVCTPAPTCSGDAACTPLGLVCDTTHGHCVDCNFNSDCGAGLFCALPEHACLSTCRIASDCNDGLYCTGTESCDPTGSTPHGCVAGTDPCAGTDMGTCNESAHSCS